MQQPPLLPEEALGRVLRTSRRNGRSIMIAAGVFALLSAASGDRTGAIAALVVAGTGAMEVHGGTLLQHGDPRGTNWLMTSQLLCLAGILGYCALRLLIVQLPPLPADLKVLIEADAAQLGISPEELVERSYRFGYTVLALASVIYQGGMTLYYQRRRPAVLAALQEG